MANRRYDEPRGVEGRSDERERLRRGPREDMHPGSRAEWDQNRRDYEDTQESVRTRDRRYLASPEYREHISRSGREYAREEGTFYDELREERERTRRYGDRTRPSSLLYDSDRWSAGQYGLGAGEPGEPGGGRDSARYGGMQGRSGPERGRYGLGTRGFGETEATRDVERRMRREELRRDVREPHTYDRRYGPMYGHGPGVENMDRPLTGYATSPSRRDDHEMGHGGSLGGGVRRERPQGRAPKGYQRSDERIREDICERLMDSWMDAENVDVQVKDGEVTLVGSVRSRDEKHAIENLAADVLGVKDVLNQLRLVQGAVRDVADSRRPAHPPGDTLHS